MVAPLLDNGLWARKSEPNTLGHRSLTSTRKLVGNPIAHVDIMANPIEPSFKRLPYNTK